MRYLALPFFKKHNDSLIRNKIFLVFNVLIFVIFFLFFLMDLYSPEQSENYHRAGRIFFPPELTKSLVLYQTIAYLFVIPFMVCFFLQSPGYRQRWIIRCIRSAQTNSSNMAKDISCCPASVYYAGNFFNNFVYIS